MERLKFRMMKSHVGMLKLVANNNNLVAILWDNERENRVRLEEMDEVSNHPILIKTEKQLREYFHNQRETFDIPIEANGTPFQQSVWRVLSEIPYGVTWTYKQVAEKIDNPRAVRAVGSAIGKNPLSIIIPCHRVIATNGGLAGFAGGLDKKQILLRLEKKS